MSDESNVAGVSSGGQITPTAPTSPVSHDGTPGNSQTVEHQTTEGPAVQPVNTDGTNRRSDDDALVGHFVDVVAGEHKGRFGAFERVLKHDVETGYPAQALIRTRDEFNQLLAVAYKDLRPSSSHGGR